MLKYFNRDVSASKVGRAVQVHGVAVVQDYVAGDTVKRICAELEPHMAGAYLGQDPFAGLRTRRLGGLIIKSQALAGLLTDPLMLGVCDHILLPHCSLYQLSYTQAIEIGPGEPAQMLHQDDSSYQIPRPRPECELLFGLALTDFTEETGATRFALGSHRWDAGREPLPNETVAAVMSAGSLVFFVGSVWHGGGSNRSAGPRLGVFVKYCLGYLRQEENQFLIAPPNIARTLEPKLRALIGYRVCVPFLGGVLEPELMELFVDVYKTRDSCTHESATVSLAPGGE